MRLIQSSFLGGELSNRMSGRVDAAIYPAGLSLCENFVPTREGPLVKRPGFEFIRPAAATATWLTGFRFNLTQQYVLEWSALTLRFFTNGARIESDPVTPYEVTTPFTAAEAPYVSQQQSYDRLYTAHSAHAPGALTRTGAATFAYADTALANGPFADGNTDETITVTVNATTVGAAATITASSGIFTAQHVGGFFRIEAKDFSDIPAWEAGINGIVVGTTKRRNEGKAYLADAAGADLRTGTNPPIHASGSEWDGMQTGTDINAKGPYGVRWQYLYDRFGILKITAYTSPTQVTATVIRRIPDSVVTVASWRWAHGAFSAAKGWPNLVSVWGGRQILVKDFDVHGSVVGDYLNHASFSNLGTVTADLAFRRTIATEDPALWIAGDRKLIVGTASRELAIGAINTALAVSGDNIAAEPQSFYGSERVFPLQLGTSTFFVQRGGRKLREAQYAFSSDRYEADDLTIAARHISRSGVVQLAYQAEPEGLLYGVRGDGEAIVHPLTKDEIKGFGRIVLGGGGKILSAVSIVGADGKTDELWALVLRGSARSIERMAPWRDEGDAIEDSFFVDAGVRVAAAAGQTHFTGATHLAGQDVAVLAAGGVVPGITVALDGSFDLPETSVPDAPYTLIVGLPFTATAVTMRPEARPNGNSIQGVKQKIVKLTLRLVESAGIRVGQYGRRLDNLIDRPADAAMDAPAPLFTGDSGRIVSGDYDRDGRATWVSDTPLPFVVTAAMMNLDADPRDV